MRRFDKSQGSRLGPCWTDHPKCMYRHRVSTINNIMDIKRATSNCYATPSTTHQQYAALAFLSHLTRFEQPLHESHAQHGSTGLQRQR
jgi:hypothetical protein